MEDITRRSFLLGAGAMACCGGIIGFPTLSMASALTNKRLLVIIQRGAMDGLSAVAPFKDRYYHDARRGLALGDSEMLNLDGFFAMHRALQPVYDIYKMGQGVVMHATATPYRERSHFDAQSILENGFTVAQALNTGWMGRTLKAMGGTTEGLVLGNGIPMVMQGSTSVKTWAPSYLPDVDADFLNRMMVVYEHDPALKNALAQAIESQGLEARGKGRNEFMVMIKTAAAFMKQPAGARLATIDIGGWDTHAQQKERIADSLANLAAGIAAFKAGMGDVWKDTAILVLTEFGRTVAQNGTAGTDHGTASTAFLLGGNVKGGKVIGDWPTLAPGKLYEGRDLYPANDIRSLLKAVLEDHMNMASEVTDTVIFPNSKTVRKVPGLFNTLPA